ncbi:MAG: daunorubicin resistance transporter ATPase subunit [Thermoleophilia bacterium]|nr:daunorubicin resistance transporter ATPase subunit [Thermoleophilia bacterium]
MSDAPPAIATHKLTRSYGDVRAVDALDLEVGAGELFALLGPNGAGKSTALGMLTTLVRPDAGTATVAGFDVARQRREVRRSIGIVFQDATLDLYLTVAENLRFHGALFNMARGDVRVRVEELLALVELSDRRDALVRTLSGGLRRRLELARALMHRPDVLFLDEPTLGLDPRARAAVAAQIDGLRTSQGTTVVLTTHYLAEAERCDRVAVIDRGVIVAEGTPEALRRAVGPGATLDDVFLNVTGRTIADDEPSLADLGRDADRQRSGRA